MNLNKVTLIGRLTKDPEMRNTASGQSVCSFGLATNRVWFDKASNQKKEETEYHNIVLWGRLAEIASQYLNKGALAFIEGRLKTRSWEDQSGNKRYRTEIIGERLQLGPRTGASRQFSPETAGVSSVQQPATPPLNQTKQGTTEAIPIIEDDADEEINVEDIPF